MSQEKVDRYKKEKANRQKIMKKERIIQRLEMAGIALVCVLAIGWVGYSVYDTATSKVNDATVVDNNAVQNYISGLAQN